MSLYSLLDKASLESLAADPTAVTGRVYLHTTTGLKWYTGSAWKIAADLDSTQTLSGKTLATPVITTAATFNAQAELRMADSDSSNYVGFKSPATVTANKIWTLPSADGSAGQVLSTDGSLGLSWVSSTTTAPTIQSFTSGSGTYTTPANVKWIRVRMVGGGGGGGGGGGASAGTAGGAGGNTTFGSSLLTANGGSGGSGCSSNAGAAGGAGGSATINSPAFGTARTGASGGYGAGNNGTAIACLGGMGGGTPFGGGGGAASNASANGGAGITNTGAGGGACGSNSSGGGGGGGGGAGGSIEAMISAPSATYSYAVGSAGTAGAGGSGAPANAGAGGSGIIIVEEYY